MPVTRGDVVDAVAATGTLQAVETVDVGTQVSGIVQELYADFNSIVSKGQVIARLDPSLIQTQIEQQEANVTRSEADLDRLKVRSPTPSRSYERAKAMFDKSLIPQDRPRDRGGQRQVGRRADQVVGSQPRAGAWRSLNNQKVNLDHTVITAPIDGIVISRSVDQGQTVAASMNAPTLFVARRRPDQDAGRRQHRRSGRGPHAPGPGGDVPRRRLPHRHVHRRGRSRCACSRRRAERRDLLDGHRRAERRAEAEAGHDRERQHRGRAQDQRAAHAGGGAPLPADRRDVPGAQPGSAA